MNFFTSRINVWRGERAAGQERCAIQGRKQLANRIGQPPFGIAAQRRGVVLHVSSVGRAIWPLVMP